MCDDDDDVNDDDAATLAFCLSNQLQFAEPEADILVI